jgi:hypothetical protein
VQRGTKRDEKLHEANRFLQLFIIFLASRTLQRPDPAPRMDLVSPTHTTAPELTLSMDLVSPTNTAASRTHSQHGLVSLTNTTSSGTDSKHGLVSLTNTTAPELTLSMDLVNLTHTAASRTHSPIGCCSILAHYCHSGTIESAKVIVASPHGRPVS